MVLCEQGEMYVKEDLVDELVCESDLDSGMFNTLEPPTIFDLQSPQRKRKERHESTSQTQERKLIRSSSEERPLEEGETLIVRDIERRVNSHEDLKGLYQQEPCDVLNSRIVRSGLPLHEHNPPAILDDLDDEHERRRISERLASYPRCGASRGRRTAGRRRKALRSNSDDGGSSKENEVVSDSKLVRSGSSDSKSSSSSASDDDTNSQASSDSRSDSRHSFLELHPQDDNERAPSPSPSTPAKIFVPPLDLSTLHQQVGGAEPMTSHASWAYSHHIPDDSKMSLTSRSYLDPNVPGSHKLSLPGEDDAVQQRIRHLTKHITNLKKRIRQYEEDTESQLGYRLSHSDKMASREIKKLISELNKSKKELKQIKENPHSGTLPSAVEGRKDTNTKLEDTVHAIEKLLQDKRAMCNRPEILPDMTREQASEEKVELQKSLLYLESLHGRPTSKGECDVVVHLYSRYRALKRLVVRSGSSKLKDSVTELAPILENEAMDFTLASPQHFVMADQVVSPTEKIDAREFEPFAMTESCTEFPESKRFQKVTPEIGENLHALSLSELMIQQRTTREEKKQLRRRLREFEEEFRRATGRRAQREDRAPVEEIYGQYKKAKAKLRLLEVLLTKHSAAGTKR